ncbi:MAG: hypothetical protein WBE26_04530 [Phycisphaerae bacterium]
MIGPMEYDDYPDEEWVDEEEDSGDDLLVCPSCKRPVHEDTQQCPHCGDWIIPVWPGQRSKRLVWVVAAVLVIVALIMMTVF